MKIKKYIIIGLSLFIFNACAGHGGGTIGTGLPLASNESGHISTGTSYVELNGTVVDILGTKIPDAIVTVATPQMEEYGVTDEMGNFALDAVIKEKDKIVVKIQVGNDSYLTSLIFKSGDYSSGSAVFKILKGGIIQISDLEWM